MSSDYIPLAMRTKIDTCLSHINLLLNQTKSSSYQISSSNDISHQYNDKYLLAEYLINTSIASIINNLQVFGDFKEKLPLIMKWCEDNHVSYRFESEQSCTFIKEIEREIEDPTRIEVQKNESIVSSLYTSKTTTKVIQTIKEYIYIFQVNYKFILFSGVGDNPLEYVTILSRQVNQNVVNHTKTNPYPEKKNYKFDIDITWLLRVLSSLNSTNETMVNTTNSSSQEEMEVSLSQGYKPSFHIDRSRADCWTPSYNDNVKEAQYFFNDFDTWIDNVISYFKTNLFVVQIYHGNNEKVSGTNLNTIINNMNVDNIFSPIYPLFIGNSSNVDDQSSFGNNATSLIQYQGSESVTSLEETGNNYRNVLLPASIVNKLLDEKHRTLLAKCVEMVTLFPDSDVIISSIEAKLFVILKDIQMIIHDVQSGIAYIEQMLRTQLVAAIGKELKSKDFAEYMDFHNKRLLKDIYQPKPFSFPVRRTINHSLEGQIRIESSISNSIQTISACSIPSHGVDISNLEETYIQFPLNASTNIRFGGERYIHGWLAHRFTGENPPNLKLIAQARQFSCYIVLIGRMNSSKVFQPKHGFIAQSKDEFTIPLELEEIPTAKEFKDAIESLSPEQQRFAKAYRSMQLEGTLFAVCIIQIKPQLEKVLNLPSDSLTKEIKLTQDLIKLFINYQIPSDLLSYDESVDTTVSVASTAEAAVMNHYSIRNNTNSRLLAVKEHVKNIQLMLDETKQEQLEAKNLEREYLDSKTSAFGSFTMAPPNQLQQPMMRRSGFGGGPPASFGGGGPTTVGFGASSFGFSAPSSDNTIRFGGIAPSAKLESINTKAAAPAVFNEGISFTTYATQQPTEISAVSTVDTMSQLPVPPVLHNKENNNTPYTSTLQTIDHSSVASITNNQIIDYTKFPSKLDATYEQLDPKSKFRSTIINVGKSWKKTAKVSLLTNTTTSDDLDESKQDQEKMAAFDLLDALTRSGALPIEHATLHLIIAGMHCFDQSLMDVVVCQNINPIERVERSTLIMAATLHDLPTKELMNYDQIQRVSTYSPMLFIEE